MIGRGALGAPWIFKYILLEHAWPLEDRAILVREYRDLIFEHALEIIEFYGETRGVLPLKIHLAWYSKGIRGSAAFRKKVMSCTAATEILRALKSFLGVMRTED